MNKKSIHFLRKLHGVQVLENPHSEDLEPIVVSRPVCIKLGKAAATSPDLTPHGGLGFRVLGFEV